MKISDSIWEAIKEVVPVKKSKVGRPEMDPRRALEAMYYVIKTGCQWHMLPRGMGVPSTVHGKFMQWMRLGIFERIHCIASQIYRGKRGRWGIWYATDTISIKAPLATQKAGKNPTDRGKQGSKRSIIVDRDGAPLSISIHPANTHDSLVVVKTFNNLKGKYEISQLNILAADAAYDAKRLRVFFKEKNFVLIAAENKRRKKIDKAYKPLHRWIVERTHSWMNQNRGLKTRWSKLESSYLAFCSFAASIQLFKMSGIFV